MARLSVLTDINVDTLTWNNFDGLWIRNGATLTVSTPQVKCWANVLIDNGTLNIVNTSSTVPIRFLMGRNTATPCIISGSSGLGIINITGSWIYLNGSGSGQPYQVFSQPYTDFVPAVWVEESAGSNTYKPWLNLTSQVGETLQYFKKDLEFAYTGSMGNFFYQETVKEPYPWSFTGSLSSSLSSSIRSGVSLLYSSSIYFGNNINGNVVPSGSRIRLPNIMVTDVTPLNLLSATSVNSANFQGTVGCVFNFDTVLFDESLGTFNQPQSLTMRNCAWSEYPTITECYSVTIDNVVLTSHPPRRYYPSTNAGWSTRDLRWGTQMAWNYISNANINGLYICNHSPTALFSNQNTATAATTANTPLYLSFCNNLTVNNLQIYRPFKSKNFQYGLILYYVNNSTFNNIGLYGGDYFNIYNSGNNTFTNITASANFSPDTTGFTTAWRIGSDPGTGNPLVLGQKYYIKTIAYRSWQDPTGSFPLNNYFFNQTGSEFVESMQYSFTPYTASKQSSSYKNHVDYLSVVPQYGLNVNNFSTPSASFTWVQRAPFFNYEIYRGTTPEFTARNGSTLVYSSSTAATVTYIDTGSVSKPLNVGSKYYYVFRKYDQAGVWSDSAEQEVWFQSLPSGSNLLRQSQLFNLAEWVKTDVSATADQKLSPNDVPIATSATLTGDLLVFTSAAGSVVQTASVIVNNPYCFSIYLSSLTSSVSMSISASSGGGGMNISSSYVIGQTWTKCTLPFTPTSTTASVGIFARPTFTAGTKIYAFGSQINTGSQVTPYITSVTPVHQRPMSVEPTSLRWWSRGSNGSGLEVTFGAAPAGTLWWELHVATSSNFIPTQNTRAASSIASGIGGPFYLSNANTNTFNTFNQITPSGYGNYFMTMANSTSNNRFLNFNLNYAYAGYPLLVINTLANDNFLHNWTVKNYRNYVSSIYWITAVNNAQGLTIQNLYSNNSDIPLYNLNLNVASKNVSAANGRPTTAAVTYLLSGGGTDQNSIVYGQVYDTIFNEFVWNPPSGSMTLNFNASSKTPLPYVITGSIFFSNTGRLYFNSTGSIEYEWPWKIYGISGFRPDHTLDAGSASIEIVGNSWLPSIVANSRDLSIPANAGYLMAPCLKKEFAFKTGSSYGGWIELSGSLSGSNPTWTALSFDPSVGFNMKVKLTARPSLNFDGQGTTPTSSFVVGEYVTGSLSGAKAKIIDQYQIVDISTDGTLVLDDITGVFRDNEILLGANNRNKGLANGTGSVNFIPANILMPQPTSYIDQLQWFTIVNTSSLYPVSSPTLTITGMKSGSTIDVIRQSDSYILDQGDISVDDEDYTFTYDYFQDTPVYLVIQNLGYVYQRLEATLTEDNLSIPVEQTIDRNYKNLPGS
jgi:hypothetical protein